MVKQLVALDADFIALQECFHTEDENYNTALSLASALGMDCRLLSYRQKQRRIEAAVQDSYSGLAILSKEPAQAEQHLSLPSVEEDGERDGLLCTFSVNDMEIALANLHLSHLRTADELRVNQLKIALELIKKNPAQCAFVCGDFNSSLALFKSANLIVPRGELVDAWQLFHGKPQSEPTVHVQHRDRGKEWESGALDHILLLPNGNVAPKVIAATRVLQNKDSELDIYPSDHVGICVDLSLEIKP